MQFSEQWLRSWVNPPLDTEALCQVLTMAGLEVEEVAMAAPMFSNVVVAEVKDVVKHDNAERLRIAYVDVGSGTLVQIVCGAPNLAIGQKVPCARPGAVLPGDIRITSTQMRGVLSDGMLCSGKELGIHDETDGLLILPNALPVGQALRDALGLDDKKITIKVTPNRTDCLSIRGIAREVAALTDCVATPLAIVPTMNTHEDTVPVNIHAKSACGRYVTRVIRKVDAAAATPDWMKHRLERAGLRSVSAIVDVSNYTLLEQGQPMHAFDLATIDNGITVRMAYCGEQLQCLNGKTVSLDETVLVIADNSKPLAIAGIMGGDDSAVSFSTRDILLESAFFAPEAIAGKARQLAISSDSSYRFERGVDFQLQREALERATQLILAICGGEAGPVVEAIGELPVRQAVNVRSARVERVLGIELAHEAIGTMLRRLALPFQVNRDSYDVLPPSFRYDIQIEEDLIEEVGRVYGYEAIQPRVLRSTMRMLPVPAIRQSRALIRRAIAARDYQEIITYAFVDQQWERDFAANFEPVRLINPIASQMNVMRSTLVGSLVDALLANIHRTQSRVRLFELSRVFCKGNSGLEQPEKLAGIAWGNPLPEQWGVKAERVDFYDVKADVDALLHPKRAEYRKASHPALHPGRSAQIVLEGKIIGVLGELHPQWVHRYDLPTPPIVFELDVNAIEAKTKVTAQPVSKFQPVYRDLALVVEEAVEGAALINTLLAAKAPFITRVTLFDVYRGKGVGVGKKSLAFQILLQDIARTLTDEEVEAAIQQLLSAVWHSHGATRRI